MGSGPVVQWQLRSPVRSVEPDRGGAVEKPLAHRQDYRKWNVGSEMLEFGTPGLVEMQHLDRTGSSVPDLNRLRRNASVVVSYSTGI